MIISLLLKKTKRNCAKKPVKKSVLRQKFKQRKCIDNSFTTSHLSYCPLVWMFRSWCLNNCIPYSWKALKIIYQYYNSNFAELLRKDSSLTIDQRNLKLLVTEMFKVKTACAPDIMKEIFEINTGNYNSCRDLLIKLHNIWSVYYTTKSASFIGPKIGNTLPNNCKYANISTSFKENPKRWIPENCPCELCETYIQRVGFF